MNEIIAYEMLFRGALRYEELLNCIPFEEKYWKEYMPIYNACFYEMRKALDIEPFNFYSAYSQMRDKSDQAFLYLQFFVLFGAFS